MNRIPNDTTRLIRHHSPHIFSGKLQPHGHAVDDVMKPNPLRTLRFVAKIKQSTVARFEGHHSVRHQLALANDDMKTANPRAFVAIVPEITLPLRGKF